MLHVTSDQGEHGYIEQLNAGYRFSRLRKTTDVHVDYGRESGVVKCRLGPRRVLVSHSTSRAG